MKRFTETAKWDDPWFFELSPPAKLLWFFLCDHCDCAGVIEISLKIASSKLGQAIKENHLAELSSRLKALDNGKSIIVSFIRFQYGKLSRDCKPHMPVFASLHKHNVSLESITQSTERGKNGAPEYLKTQVRLRDGPVCAYTGKQHAWSELVIDHVVPRAAGGGDTLDNLVVASEHMNIRKAALSVEQFCEQEGLDLVSVRTRINERLSKGTKVGSQSLQEKEKEKEKEKVQDQDPVRKEECREENHYHPDSRTVLYLLNEATGRHYRETDANLAFISARLHEQGVTLDGVKLMLSRQCKRWAGTEQAEYLRPETLFNKTKFDGYYAAKDLPVEKDNGTHQHNPQSNGRRLTGAEQRQVGIPASRGLGAGEIVRRRNAERQRERDSQADQNGTPDGVAAPPVQP